MSANKPAYSVPLYRRLIRGLMRLLFRAFFYLLGRVRIQGLENIPAKGSYLVASNHISLFEPPFILAFWPEALEAVGAVEIWERPGQNILVRLYGGIPVHRGEYDRQLVEKLIRVLASGYPLLIAPEGGRTHTIGMRRANPGAAYIADQTGVQVVPVGIQGTSDDFLKKAFRWKRPTIEMHIGVPFRMPALEGRGEARRLARQQNADIIMQHIADLLPPVYHGVYARVTEPTEPQITADYPLDLPSPDDAHS
jgi:1-acyl-sn-glycerol-3-phosphate acyltransferase